MAVQYEFRQEKPDVEVATLTGQLNLGNRLADFEHQVKQRIEHGARKIVLDLSGLTYIDSAGLGMIATCAGTAAQNGGSMVVVSAGGKITQMFKLTRLDRLIDVFPTLEAALQSLSAPPKETPSPDSA